MKTFLYLLLDAFVVFLAIALIWVLLRKGASFLSCSFKLLKQLKFKREEKPNLRQPRSCATPIERESQDSMAVLVETKILTPLQEFTDWSQYDSPAYLRKGIIIH
ncbi:MAG: hypothetical protein G8D89_16450 [gamma proteobacterium symbiont of Clathrolucina costata]